jgi:hypothetical protein
MVLICTLRCSPQREEVKSDSKLTVNAPQDTEFDCSDMGVLPYLGEILQDYEYPLGAAPLPSLLSTLLLCLIYTRMRSISTRLFPSRYLTWPERSNILILP